jgi:hypothetical protein
MTSDPAPPLLSPPELARAHTTDMLLWTLRGKLHHAGHWYFCELIRKGDNRDADGPACAAGIVARALIARLRFEGRDALADTLASRFREAAIDAVPTIDLSDDDGWIAEKNDVVARTRAVGYHKEAARYVSDELDDARRALVKRLLLDGHRDLAKALDDAYWAFERRSERDRAEPVAAEEPAYPPEVSSFLAQSEMLERAYSVDVLASAVLVKLRSEGRLRLAGAIMTYWLEEMIGPIVDPANLAAFVIRRLRAEGRGEVAETYASLLHGAAIHRDPEQIGELWRQEIAGPLIDAEGLAAALVARIRWEKREAFPGAEQHEELADAIIALLNPTDPSPVAR